MSYSCPLNFIKVDSNASRLSSFIVASLVIIYLLTSIEYILFFLVLDFSLKLFIDKKYAPIFVFALFLRKAFKMQEKFTDGGAKRLAGFFGLFFVSLLLIIHFLQLGSLSLLVAALFLSCSLLDVFLNFCLGCQIYYLVKKIYPSFMS
ncbi:DUF4395 domain-containing protein [Sulfurimonas sp. SAG-AH-194-I05]|nr:DUF4395 domain-containing protein [Sulfurimonas sp. SAG-AH-194-I05]MDF1874722.1 DUF4395 domain-containing protein [Sulfurimonas sp. SAG-AH-194-I05]